MKQTIKAAFTATIPVMAGYLVLGFGFGIIMHACGFSMALAVCMSAFIYAGSMQYVAVGLLTGGASLLTAALTTLMVNARHLFYGVSMLEKYKDTGRCRPYLIFTLTDETYSLLCGDNAAIPDGEKHRYYFWVSLFDHLYWVAGSAMGAAIGSVVRFNSDGIDFALTALFLTVFLEQWLSAGHRAASVIGVAVSAACLLLFGPEHFLIPAMLIITLMLCLYKEERKHD